MAASRGPPQPIQAPHARENLPGGSRRAQSAGQDNSDTQSSPSGYKESVGDAGREGDVSLSLAGLTDGAQSGPLRAEARSVNALVVPAKQAILATRGKENTVPIPNRPRGDKRPLPDERSPSKRRKIHADQAVTSWLPASDLAGRKSTPTPISTPKPARPLTSKLTGRVDGTPATPSTALQRHGTWTRRTPAWDALSQHSQTGSAAWSTPRHILFPLTQRQRSQSLSPLSSPELRPPPLPNLVPPSKPPTLKRKAEETDPPPAKKPRQDHDNLAAVHAQDGPDTPNTSRLRREVFGSSPLTSIASSPANYPATPNERKLCQLAFGSSPLTSIASSPIPQPSRTVYQRKAQRRPR